MLAEGCNLFAFPPKEKGGFFMENNCKTQIFLEKCKVFLSKYGHYLIAVLGIALLSFCFIGNFYHVREVVDGVKFNHYYSLGTLLFNNPAGMGVQVIYLCIYLIMPLLSCIFLCLHNIHRNFTVAALLMFSFCAVTSIVTKDILVDVLKAHTGNSLEVKKVFFSGVLPTITLFVVAVLSFAVLSSSISITVADITEMGMLIAIALGLNFIKLFQMPTGGSVNFQMLPLFILALRKGPVKSFIGAGIIYGLVSCMTDGYGFATYPFDYVLGFGSVCIIGFFTPFMFKEKGSYGFKGMVILFLVCALSTTLRFIAGTISSMVIYGVDFVGSLVYNSLYVYISGLICTVVLLALYGPIKSVNKRFPSNRVETSSLE